MSSTMPAVTTFALIVQAAAYGVDPAPLFELSGLDPTAPPDPDARLSAEVHWSVFERIGADPRQRWFGLHLGQQYRPEYLGAVGFAMTQSADVRGVFACLERYARVALDEVTVRLREEPDAAVFHLTLRPRVARLVLVGDALMASIVATNRTFTGKRLPIREVWFQHARPDDPRPYREVFGEVPLRFGAPETAIHADPECADYRLPRADPSLFAYLTRHAQTLLARLKPDERVADKVRALLAEQLRTGEPSQARAAKALAMSERTLQRRLQQEGVAFADLREDVRRELAHLYLEDRHLAVYEVAYLLGYSEPSAFHRAFRRWTGQTPQEFRARL